MRPLKRSTVPLVFGWRGGVGRCSMPGCTPSRSNACCPVGARARLPNRWSGNSVPLSVSRRRARALVGPQGHVDPASGAVDGHEQAPSPGLFGHLRQVLHVDMHEAGFVGLEGIGRGLIRRRLQRTQTFHAVATQVTDPVQTGAS